MKNNTPITTKPLYKIWFYRMYSGIGAENMFVLFNADTKRWEVKDFVTGSLIQDFRTREEARKFKKQQIIVDEASTA